MGDLRLRGAGIALVLLLSVPALAENKDAARVAYSEAMRYYDLNRFEQALEAFQRAYWNYEDPVFLFNIAQCHRLLKHHADAVAFYRSYLRKLPEVPNRADVNRLISEVQAEMALEQQAKQPPPAAAKEPPPNIAAPANPNINNATLTATAPPPPPRRKWVIPVVVVGAIVVAGALGVGLGLGLTPHTSAPSLGTVHPQ